MEQSKQRIRQPHTVRRHQIQEAVRKLITTKGMSRVTINEIAKEIGVTEGAIYRHFTGKRQIFIDLIEQWRESLLSAAQGDAEDGTPALERLEQAFWAQLDEVENYRALSSMIIVQAITLEGIDLGATVGSVVDEYLEVIRGFLSKGIEEGSIRPDLNPDAAATIFFGMIQTTASLWAFKEFGLSLTEPAVKIWETYKKSIAIGVP